MKSTKRDIIINAGFGLAMAILVVIGYLYYLNVKAMTEFDRMVERSQVMILELEGLLSATKDVENGEHIFTITGEERYLEPYHAAIGQIDRRLATLRILAKNHPAQQDRVYRIEPLIRERLAEAEKTIDIRKREGYRAASQREFTGRHKRFMDEIRGQLTEAQGSVMEHLDRRKALKEASARNMILTFFAGSSLSFALLMTIFILLRRDITERKKTEEKFRGLLESAPEAVVIVNDKGEICIVNSQTEELFGYEREELYGRKVEVLVPERFRNDHVKQRVDYFLDPQVRRMGTVTKLCGLRKDGREFPADISLSPVSTDEGGLVIATIRDITGPKLMEETLRFSEARYRALFRDNPTMIVTLDADLTMLSVNPICACLLGYTIDELEGRSVLVLFHEEDHPEVIEQLRKCMQNPGQMFRWQFRKVRKDGGLLWVEETAQSVYDLNGELNLLVVCQDITERKRMEDELKKTSMQNELILASAGEGIVGLDLEGNQTFVNAAAAAMLGYDVTELVGKHSHSTWHHARPDGSRYPVEDCPVYAAYKDGTVHSGEETFLRKDGTGFPVLFTSRPIFSDGKITGAVLTFNDITEHKRMEGELRESEEQLESVLENINEGVVISDLDGNVLKMNKEALALHEYESIEQVRKQLSKYQETFELFDLEGRPIPFEQWPLVRVLQGDRFVDYEVRVLHKNSGKLCTWSYSGTPVRGKSGDVILSVITMRDITERKFAEEEIEKLNTNLAARAAELEVINLEMEASAAELEAANVELEAVNVELEAFNYTVAHDLRNPLNVIGSYCQVIKELCGVKLDEQCRRYLQETYEGTLRMNRLIEALLQFSRMAHAELNRDNVNLSGMAREVAGELKGTEAARRVEFRIADGIAANGDANLLRMVLNNLLGNAWKYTGMRDDGIIEFGVKEIDGNPAYFVQDNGAGFDMADAARLFAPFQRLPGAEECRGFGIGLATVDRIIRRHGGRTWAEGEPGRGATFWFTLSGADVST